VKLQPYKCRFSVNAADALQYFANRVVLEFRALPYAPTKVAPMSVSGADTPASAVAAPSVYAKREGVHMLEVLKTSSYVEMMERLAHVINIDPQRLKVFRPSLSNDDVPDSNHVTSTHWMNLDTCPVRDVLSRGSDVPAIFYYSVMQYTWAELEKNVPVTINYNDKHLVLWTWQTLVPKTAKFSDLAAQQWRRLRNSDRQQIPRMCLLQTRRSRSYIISPSTTVRQCASCQCMEASRSSRII